MFSHSYPWNKLKFIDDSFYWRHKTAFTYFEETRENWLGQWPSIAWALFFTKQHGLEIVIGSKNDFTTGGLESPNIQCNQDHDLAVPSAAHAMNSHVNTYSLAHLYVFLLRKAKITTLFSAVCLHLVPSKSVGSPVWADMLWPQTDQE